MNLSYQVYVMLARPDESNIRVADVDVHLRLILLTITPFVDPSSKESIS